MYRCVQMIYFSSCVFCCGIKKQFSACEKRNVSGITVILNNCGPTVSEQVWTCGFHLSVAFPYLSYFHVCLLVFFYWNFLSKFSSTLLEGLSAWVLDVSILRGKSAVDDVRWLAKTKPHFSSRL